MQRSRVAAMASSGAVLELRDVPVTDPWETVRRGARLISRKTGLIRQVGHGLYHAQDPVTFALGIAAGDVSRFSDITNTSKGGGGGERLEIALAATIGEAVERYCMLFYDKSTMVLASHDEVANVAASPDALRLYSQEQVAGRPPESRLTYFTAASKINWVWGTSLTHHRLCLVPAGLVYLGYAYGDDEAFVGRNASSGLAAGLTIEEAILTGLYELIERDAVTIRWLQDVPGTRVAIDDPELQQFMDERFHAEHPAVDLRIVDTSLDVDVPCMFAIMQRPAEFGPALCVGSAARLDPKQAIVKSLREAGQALPYFRFLLAQLADWEPRADFTDLTSFDHHCVMYLKRPEIARDAMARWVAGAQPRPLSAIARRATGTVLGDVQKCVAALQRVGIEVIVVEITTPDVRELGMRVVRVLAPGLMPLHGNHNLPYLGVRRLTEVPHTLEWQQLGWRPDRAINRYPHPFP